MFGRFFQSLSKKLFKTAVHGTSRRKPATRKLEVEGLESRQLMAAQFTAPILTPVADLSMTSREDAVTATMVAFDANGDSLSVEVGAPGTAAYELDERLGLTRPARTPRGAQPLRARWMHGAGGQTYGILPNGELRQWRGTLARTRQRDAVVARLDVGYHLNPRLLWQAPPPAALPADVHLHAIPFMTSPRTIDVLQLTVDPSDGYLGTFTVEVSVSDGRATAVRSFAVTVHRAPNQAPVLEAIADQSISTGDTAVVPLIATDFDGDAITYTARAIHQIWPADAPSASLNIHGNELRIDADVTGSLVIEVSASDGVATASQTFQLTVVAANHAPVFEPIADQTMTDADILTVTLNASDADGDPISYAVRTVDEAGAPIGIAVNIALSGNELTIDTAGFIGHVPVLNETGEWQMDLTVNGVYRFIQRSYRDGEFKHLARIENLQPNQRLQISFGGSESDTPPFDLDDTIETLTKTVDVPGSIILAPVKIFLGSGDGETAYKLGIAFGYAWE
ncbi:MAG: Ig-like domain-containing protein [Gemmataceae bacterium]|nr:Ig-like domain-containing protein [Gemmataceae bacterium]